MSKAEVEKFVALLRRWAKSKDDDPVARVELLAFLHTYEQPLINALRFYAADK